MRFRGAVRRAGRRLQDHTIAAGFAVAAIGALMAWIAWTSVNGVPLQQRYALHVVIPAGSPIVKAGDAVRESGRLAGIVQKVEPYHGNRIVSVQLRPAFAPVGRDAQARVTVRSILYLTYLEIFPGNVRDALPSDATIPLSRTSHGVDLLQVVQLFGKQVRRTLRKAVFNSGLGLAGRGRGLNEALADLPAVSTDGTSELRALTSHPGAIAASIAGAGRIARGLAGRRADDVSGAVDSAGTLLGALATRRQELGQSLDRLAPLEQRLLATAPLADPLLDRTASLLRTLKPAVGRLAAALPDINRALAQGDALRRNTHRLTGFLRPLLAGAIPLFGGLRNTVASVDPMLSSLQTLVGVITPYQADISRAGRNLVSITTKRYPEGLTAPDNPVLRFTPIFSRAACRDPYPAPNTAINHSGTC